LGVVRSAVDTVQKFRDSVIVDNGQTGGGLTGPHSAVEHP
jgi:hypothetical protein